MSALPFSLGDANLSVRFGRSLARMVRYELVFIIEANDDTAARRAANKAWSALDDATGVAVKDSSARRRARNGRPVAVGWKDWQEEPCSRFESTSRPWPLDRRVHVPRPPTRQALQGLTPVPIPGALPVPNSDGSAQRQVVAPQGEEGAAVPQRGDRGCTARLGAGIRCTWRHTYSKGLDAIREVPIPETRAHA